MAFRLPAGNKLYIEKINKFKIAARKIKRKEKKRKEKKKKIHKIKIDFVIPLFFYFNA
jgi:hypothetical protein